MSVRFHFIAILLMLLAAATTVKAQETPQASKNNVIKIGVLTKGNEALTTQQWPATAGYLNQHIKSHRFEIVALDFSDIEAAVKEKRIDFLLANPATYVRLEAQYEVNAVLTLKRRLTPTVSSSLFAGVILVRHDREDIQRIVDLKNKTFAAVDEMSFGGWAMAWRQMKLNNINPYDDLKRIDYVGSHESVVNAVLNGLVDAGTIRTGILERMSAMGEIDINEVRALPEEGGAEHQMKEFPLLHSTLYYPEWPFMSLSHVDDALVKQVVEALLLLQPEDQAAMQSGIVGWYPPLNYESVHALLKDLQLAQYKYYGQVSLLEAMRQHWQWVSGGGLVLLLLVALTFNSIRLYKINVSANAALIKEVDDKDKARNELLAKSEKLTNVLETIAEAFMTVDRDWQIIDINSHAQEFFDQSKVNMIDHNLWDVLPELASFAYSGFTKSLAKSIPGEFTAFYPPTQRWIEFHTFPSGHEMDIYFHDVTDRVEKDAALKDSEQRLRSILDNVFDGVITIDEEGIIQTFNAAAENIFGYRQSEVVGQKVDMLMPMSGHEKYLKRYLVSNQPRVIGLGRELEGRRKSGELFPLDIAISEAIIQGKRMFIGITRDITEKRKAQAETKRLVAAIHHAADGIYITNADGQIVYVNPAYENMTGFSRDELKNKKPAIFEMATEDQSQYAVFIDAMDKEESWQGRCNAVRKNGQLYVEEISVTPVFEGGNLAYCVGVCRDATEKLRYEQHLHHAEKMQAVATLSGGIAHEFNNLLSAIIGYTDMTLADVDPHGPETKNLTQVMGAANRAKTLVKQMLLFSQQDYEKPQIIKPNEVVKEAVDLLRAVFPPSVSIKQDIENDVGNLWMAPGQFQQVTMNLALNSLKAMGDVPGIVDISLQKNVLHENSHEVMAGLSPGSYVVLQISDTGCGMSKEIKERIFEPFFSADEAGEGHGLGLGLAAVYGIVTSNGGTIQVESEVGEGSTFRVFLPLADDEIAV